MNIVVLVKQVPDTYSERKLSDADHTLDRDAADAVLDEINERAVEEALLIKEAQGGEVTVDGVDLVIAGNESTDGVAGAVPAIVAELLGLPQLTHARKVELDGTTVKVERETADEGLTKLEASLPAL